MNNIIEMWVSGLFKFASSSGEFILSPISHQWSSGCLAGGINEWTIEWVVVT